MFVSKHMIKRAYYNNTVKKIWNSVTKWIWIENSILPEVTQTQRQICYIFTYMWTLAVKFFDNQTTICITSEVR